MQKYLNQGKLDCQEKSDIIDRPRDLGPLSDIYLTLKGGIHCLKPLTLSSPGISAWT
jgi:hypothetical protein